MSRLSRNSLELPLFPDWKRMASCLGLPDETVWELFFPVKETEEHAAEVYRDWCRSCPVQRECLTDALRLKDHGIFAGTTTVVRRKLLRKRSRAKCPSCGGRTEAAVLAAGDDGAPVLSEVCHYCGVSWPSDQDPKTVTLNGRTRIVVDVSPVPEAV